MPDESLITECYFSPNALLKTIRLQTTSETIQRSASLLHNAPDNSHIMQIDASITKRRDGFPLKILCNREKSEQYQCSICLDVCRSPVTCQSGVHLFCPDCLAKSLQNEIPSVQFVRNLSLFPCLAPLRQHEYQLLTLFAYTKRVSGKELVVDSITILTLSVNADPSSVQEKEAVGQLFPVPPQAKLDQMNRKTPFLFVLAPSHFQPN